MTDLLTDSQGVHLKKNVFKWIDTLNMYYRLRFPISVDDELSNEGHTSNR